MKRLVASIFLSVLVAAGAMAQRPGGGRPPIGQPGPGGRPPIGMPGPRPAEGPRGDWVEAIDQNGDKRIDAAELTAGIERTFSEFDRDTNGVLAGPEMRRMPEPMGDRMNNQGRPRNDGFARRILPPFFFNERFEQGGDIAKSEFERVVRGVFNQMDANSDGFVDQSESRPPKGLGRGPEHNAERPMRPNAQFIAAELRFGDKLIKDKPFSAEMQIEDTRRLFDGSTVTKKISGATYRDSAGRTRREQPIDIGGFGVVGTDNKPQTLVFINDFATRTQYFLDANQKVARKSPLGDGNIPDPKPRIGAQVEDLGTREIEGVQAKGTRETFEIPAAHLGTTKPMQVVTEVWFSPELQVIVMSRHLDPVAGQHVFRLVNIKRAEPAASLFEVPSDYKVLGKPMRDE
ncbi:MAG: hypothetical protein JNL64_13275 [Blastocatellia bacterium]|nr:hypothetical protein [Blastocatellia bacterium]